MRTCEMCGISIEHRNGNAKYCGPCSKKVEKEARQKYDKNKKNPEKFCVFCGKNITHQHGNCKWCGDCQKNFERFCIDCGTDISDRPHNCKRCESCQEKYETERRRIAGKVYRSNKKAKKKSTPSAMDKSNFARKYHSSYGRIENDIKTGRVKPDTEDVGLAKELGLM